MGEKKTGAKSPLAVCPGAAFMPSAAVGVATGCCGGGGGAAAAGCCMGLPMSMLERNGVMGRSARNDSSSCCCCRLEAAVMGTETLELASEEPKLVRFPFCTGGEEPSPL